MRGFRGWPRGRLHHPLFFLLIFVLFLQLRQQNKRNPYSWQVSGPSLSEFSRFDPGDSHKDDRSFRAKYRLFPNKDSWPFRLILEPKQNKISGKTNNSHKKSNSQCHLSLAIVYELSRFFFLLVRKSDSAGSYQYSIQFCSITPHGVITGVIGWIILFVFPRVKRISSIKQFIFLLFRHEIMKLYCRMSKVGS